MSTLILTNGHRDECRLWEVKDREDAKYRWNRIAEKEGLEFSLAYLVDDSDKLPVDEWALERHEEQYDQSLKDTEDRERSEYERLKNKFSK
jgi:hypothetical protein